MQIGLLFQLIFISACSNSHTGTLSINAEPWAYITIPDVVDQAETPLLNREIPAGTYEMLIAHPLTNSSLKTTITVSPGTDMNCLAYFDVENPERKPIIDCKKKIARRPQNLEAKEHTSRAQ